jgi:hypothetical protein
MSKKLRVFTGLILMATILPCCSNKRDNTQPGTLKVPDATSLEASKVQKKTDAANDSAQRALRAIRKIAAGTKVGVSRQQYSQLVIDAQAEVDEATDKLPDGELKVRLIETMEIYTSVNKLWANQIKHDQLDDPKINQGIQKAWQFIDEEMKRVSDLVEAQSSKTEKTN